MGEPITRLNPQVESSIQRSLLEDAVKLLLSIAFLFPERTYLKRGQQPYDYRKLMALCILRILLRKTYADYEIEMRTDCRICSLLELKILPGKSTLQRYTDLLTMTNLWEFNRLLLKDFLQSKLNLALDASGMRIVGRSIWYCLRIKKEISRREFDKVHIAIGLDVLFVFNWRISDGKRHDSPFFRLLLAPISILGLVVADLGYSSRANVQLVANKNGACFIPFKSNATGKSKSKPAWKMLFWIWSKFKTIFDGLYHQRSKVESVFHALKERYGEELYCKSKEMRRKEMALRFVAYNLRLFIYWKFAMESGLNLYVRA
jgi:hypothetical protein